MPSWLIIVLMIAGAVGVLVLYARREINKDPCKGCAGCSVAAQSKAKKKRERKQRR